jgi:hypothetical protein
MSFFCTSCSSNNKIHFVGSSIKAGFLIKFAYRGTSLIAGGCQHQVQAFRLAKDFSEGNGHSELGNTKIMLIESDVSRSCGEGIREHN